MRKMLNDAAYQGLDYVPYSSTMPVQKDCSDPKFVWVRDRKGGPASRGWITVCGVLGGAWQAQS